MSRFIHNTRPPACPKKQLRRAMAVVASAGVGSSTLNAVCRVECRHFVAGNINYHATAGQ
jgi:hypothetical protein